MTRWIESGTPSAPVWLIGEAPGADEVEQGRPLVGASGRELDAMLREAGWPSSTNFFRTNICHSRPPSYQNKHGKWIHNDIEQFFLSPKAASKQNVSCLSGRFPLPPICQGLERLEQLIRLHQPQLIIALGGTPLWALAGYEGITKWRGSVLSTSLGSKLLSTFHPADVLYQWTHRPIVVQDLRRALRESDYPDIRKPSWHFTVAPTLSDVRDWLTPLIAARAPLVCDTEGWGVVDCIGFADSTNSAICIPFIRQGESVDSSATLAPYWEVGTAEQVLDLCVQALTQCPITFHNATWDCQVIGRRWGVIPRLTDDTMLMQHVLLPGMLGGKIDPVTGRVDKKGSSLSLSFIASMYCDYYRYWKDDGRVRDEDYDDETYWRYNCEDCVRTFECRDSLESSLRSSHLWEQYQFEMSLFGPVLAMMFRGLRLDQRRVAALRSSIDSSRRSEQQWLDTALGYSLNVNSNPQIHALFYDDLACQRVLHRSTKQPTVDDPALELIARRQPLLLPLVRKIQNIRSLNVNDNNFLSAAEQSGARLRTCLNIPGAETFRFSSNETAFGEGCNLQNLTRTVED